MHVHVHAYGTCKHIHVHVHVHVQMYTHGIYIHLYGTPYPMHTLKHLINVHTHTHTHTHTRPKKMSTCIWIHSGHFTGYILPHVNKKDIHGQIWLTTITGHKLLPSHSPSTPPPPRLHHTRAHTSTTKELLYSAKYPLEFSRLGTSVALSFTRLKQPVGGIPLGLELVVEYKPSTHNTIL